MLEPGDVSAMNELFENGSNEGYIPVWNRIKKELAVIKKPSTNIERDVIALLYEIARLLDSVETITKGSHIYNRIMKCLAQQTPVS